MIMKISTKIAGCLLMLSVLLFTACKKENKSGFLSPALKYPNSTLNAKVGGRLIISSAVVTDESTKPLEFSIVAIRNEDGSPATKLMEYKVDTHFWKAAYTEKEKNTKELEAKIDAVTRPAVDINPINGQIIIYPEASDSLKITKGKYFIDVKVKNSAEERVIVNAMTLNVTYQGDFYYNFLGTDGSVKNFTVDIKRVALTGNKITVRALKPDGTPINPKSFEGFDYDLSDEGFDIKDWHNLGLENPTTYLEFPDRLELAVSAYPVPFVAGKVVTIDVFNNGSINGAYMNFWFEFALYKEGIWDITIKLEY